MCAKVSERKIKWLREDEAQASMAVYFQAYGRPLETVTEFKYLGWVLTASDENWPVVVTNIRKAQIR